MAAWRDELLAGVLPSGRDVSSDGERVALLEALEQLSRAAVAIQADVALALDASQRAQQAAVGEPAARQGRGVAAQIALARRCSPHRGQMFLGVARALSTELPHTRVALREGVIDEHAARLVVAETACLQPEDRLVVDEEACGDHEGLEGLGTRRLLGDVRRRVLRIDPASAVRRAARAAADRCVTLRPAPDTMAYLTALVPVAQGVAAVAALGRDADAGIATGAAGDRSRGQVMADLLVERLTGQVTAEAVPVEVSVVISDAALLGGDPDPATLVAGGVGREPLPAQIARELIARASEADLAWVRRLYARPDGELVALTSRQRFVRGGLAAFLRLRDQGLCRTPWCDAPARHADHVVPANAGGSTTAHDTQSLCAACNHAKQAPGWAARPRPGPGPQVVETTTPTGSRHLSRAPSPPWPADPPVTALDHALDLLHERLAS